MRSKSPQSFRTFGTATACCFAVLAGTGLRAGEIIGLKVEDISPDGRVISIRRAVWCGREQSAKTDNAVREIDVPVALGEMLRNHVAGRTGYVFTTRLGRPLSQRNLLRVLHAVARKGGFHAFRRFRASVLRKARVPEDLVRLWLGHAGRSVTARQLREDLPFRQEWAERVGLGISVGLCWATKPAAD